MSGIAGSESTTESSVSVSDSEFVSDSVSEVVAESASSPAAPVLSGSSVEDDGSAAGSSLSADSSSDAESSGGICYITCRIHNNC